ncbi:MULTISPECIES: ChrR family anti-sigma-E factor [Ferrimonas]|uniref:ChrR family anti-sigma-E factor n=1 Tax=Ferrimonas TaxID=44011 RepID=UPI0004214052|nr:MULTISPECIES: ChrR family anti-sigma-E factor [Ferrimonas]USD38333.1 ChrR family anti-sigma-E factor [Ferrimonas sp. SCSIO 43195]
MTERHPTLAQIEQFIQGDLDDIQAIMVSVHLGACSQCSQLAQQCQQRQASHSLMPASDVEAFDDADLDQILAQLDSEEPASAQPDVETRSPTQLEFQGRTVSVPPALSTLVARAGPWSRVVSRLWSATIQGHQLPYQLNFIYMEPGGSIATHAHKGLEWTLVLDGTFSDDRGDFHPGDLIQCDDQVEHAPYSENGCLCLAAIDAPLHFTSGLARALNPFSQLFFKPGG